MRRAFNASWLRRHNGCRFFAGGQCTTRFGCEAVPRKVSTAPPSSVRKRCWPPASTGSELSELPAESMKAAASSEVPPLAARGAGARMKWRRPRSPISAPALPRVPRYVCWTTASPFGYTAGVGYAVTKSATFLRWLKELRDKRAQARIAIRIDRVQEGNFGDHKAVGGGVSELRIPVGQGYRVYYTIREGTVVVLLCGGDKSSQPQDIRRAQRMAIEV